MPSRWTSAVPRLAARGAARAAARTSGATEHLRPAIERGPREVDLPAIRRLENEALATQVRLYRESLGALKPEDATLPFA